MNKNEKSVILPLQIYTRQLIIHQKQTTMKKFFLLLVAACLLCCVSCKDEPQPAPAQKDKTAQENKTEQESKNSPAFDAAMKIFDKVEKGLEKCKTCEDLEKIIDDAEIELGKWIEKYDYEKDLTNKEEKKYLNRFESIDNEISRKKQEFGCGGGYDDSGYGYNDYDDYDDDGY